MSMDNGAASYNCVVRVEPQSTRVKHLVGWCVFAVSIAALLAIAIYVAVTLIDPPR
jgi:hypothetical protein